MGRRLNSVSGFLLLAILWEAAPRLGLADPKFFPPLSTLLVELFSMAATQEFWGYLLSTARTWAIGLLVATAAGVIAGLAIGLVPGARTYTHSTIEFLRPIQERFTELDADPARVSTQLALGDVCGENSQPLRRGEKTVLPPGVGGVISGV